MNIIYIKVVIMRAIYSFFSIFSFGFIVKSLLKYITGYAFAGAEAMFADLGHFSVRSIQVGQCISITSPLKNCFMNIV